MSGVERGEKKSKARDVSRGRLSVFARRLFGEWRKLKLDEGATRVVVAVSGGADSAALLLALEELSRAGRVGFGAFVVAHLDHGLRGEAGAGDARWVCELASKLGVECVAGRIDVKRLAKVSGDNLEQAARRARYKFLGETARAKEADVVLTAHTLDDQAETILLRLLRGSGAQGLSGMRAARDLDEAARDEGVRKIQLVRPLLSWARRGDTEKYCRARGVEFRADEMNDDERFARVRVRKRLLPLLENFNPRVVETLARTAELIRDDAQVLEEQADELLAEATETDAAKLNASELKTVVGLLPLRVEVLARAHAAVRGRALRKWIASGRGGLRRLESSHVWAVEKLLEGEKGGRVAELPGGARVERRRKWLFFHGVSGEKS